MPSSGERRLPACRCRQLAGSIMGDDYAFVESFTLDDFRQAAENNRLAACAPQRFALCLPRHAAKKKMPVSTAFMTNIASKACTTEVVVACPTPSAPPSTVSPALHAMVITIQANTTLLIIPEYKSQGSALCSASRMKPAVLKSSANT